MEIRIDVPSFLHPLIDGWMRYLSYTRNVLMTVQLYLAQCYQSILSTMTIITSTIQGLLSQCSILKLFTVSPSSISLLSNSTTTQEAIPLPPSLSPSSYMSNVIVPIIALLLVFWPIVLSIIMTVVTAWAWIIWILTSILLGVIQIIYATYQFMMICLDIGSLSILKTYVIVVRNRFLLSFVPFFNGSNQQQQQQQRRKTSRRKVWRQRLEQTKNYEEFLKIRIETKDARNITSTTGSSTSSSTSSSGSTKSGSGRTDGPIASDSRYKLNDNDSNDDEDCTDTALPPRRQKQQPPMTTTMTTMLLGRSNSFTSIRSSESEKEASTAPLFRRMSRNLSFTGGGSLVDRDHNHSSSTTNTNTTTVHCHDPMTIQEIGQSTADLLVTTTYRLEQSRLACMECHKDNNDNCNAKDDEDHDNNSNINNNNNDSNNRYAEAVSTMQYLLAGVVKRNHLQLDELLVQDARSIAEMGMYGLSKSTRYFIKSYYQEVEKCLDYIADAPTPSPLQRHPNFSQYQSNRLLSSSAQHQHQPAHGDLYDRIRLVRKMKQNIGRTALMLSGGGAQAMYHLGVVKALIESNLYHDIKVISGTSGGSITAAMCAIKTSDELQSDVCVNTVSTDFLLTGEMKKQNIRWFPPMYDMATYWIKHKLLVDSAYFGRTCEFYFKDFTFEEAFVRTGKHVCITVSASRASGTTAQRLLLNHISTPHVTIASAVRASCALPGVMAPAKLIVKSSSGILEPFEVDGVEWIDGSVQADLPFQRIATLFAITSFIVSQTNFHVVPFLNKEHHPDNKSLYWTLFQTIEWDIRSRALKLSRLGLFPKIFGQDVSKVFKQKYHGNLTIVPRFTTMQTFGLKALSNPTVKDMDGYLKYSQIATWPYLNAIRDMIRLEKALDDCLTRLEGRIRSINPESDWSTHDEIDSIESSSVMAASSSIHRVRIIGRPAPTQHQPNGSSVRETEQLRRKVSGLERENQQLREELEKLQSGDKSCPNKEGMSELLVSDDIDTDCKPTLSDGSEGEVWNLVRGAGTSESTTE